MAENVLKCLLKEMYSSINVPSKGRWLTPINSHNEMPCSPYWHNKMLVFGHHLGLLMLTLHGIYQNYRSNHIAPQPSQRHLFLRGSCEGNVQWGLLIYLPHSKKKKIPYRADQPIPLLSSEYFKLNSWDHWMVESLRVSPSSIKGSSVSQTELSQQARSFRWH